MGLNEEEKEEKWRAIIGNAGDGVRVDKRREHRRPFPRSIHGPVMKIFSNAFSYARNERTKSDQLVTRRGRARDRDGVTIIEEGLSPAAGDRGTVSGGGSTRSWRRRQRLSIIVVFETERRRKRTTDRRRFQE